MKSDVSILSFDVGLRNLAFCLLKNSNIEPQEKDSKFGHIDAWDVIDLGKASKVTSVEECAKRLSAELAARFGNLDKPLDYVIIERQPQTRSVMMVAIQMFLCMYFSAPERAVHVRFSNASRKLCMELVDFPRFLLINEDKKSEDKKSEDKKSKATAKKYCLNKSYAIDATKKYLEVMEDFANLSLLEEYKKKDDLCDAFLQAIAFIENDGVCTKPRKPVKTKKVKQIV